MERKGPSSGTWIEGVWRLFNLFDKSFHLAFILAIRKRQNRHCSLVKLLSVAQQFEHAVARSTTGLHQTLPELVGPAVLLHLKPVEQVMNSLHHFRVVAGILLLQFQNLAPRPIEEQSFFGWQTLGD